MSSILGFISDFFYNIIDFLLGWVHLPAFPASFSGSIDKFLSLIFDDLSLLGFFIRPITLKIAVFSLVILLNFDILYKIIVWIIRKIPFLNVS